MFYFILILFSFTIKKLINEFLLIRIDIVMTDIQTQIGLVKKGIEDGKFEWE